VTEIWGERVIGFLIFWGIWLLIPLIVDVSTCLVYLINFLVNRNKKEEEKPDLVFFPFVTLVIPVHNSADTLKKCLNSIANQTYPAEHIQIICVNNGSEDNSFEVFNRFQNAHPEMSIAWNSLERAGKSIALNAGLYSGSGTYMMNVDADTWLDQNAVMSVVKAFENDPTLAAATGSIRVDKELGEGSSFLDLINYCEVIEYILAFDVGRRYQDLKDAVFTLSGAFSMFRRDIILQSYLYQTRTVSEDTDLTFNIRKAIENSGGRIGFVADALAYVEPIESLDRLYSQRLRWQRGEIEVTGAYYSDTPNIFRALFDFVGRILISDHTLAFIRMAWTFLLPFLYLLGYPMGVIILAFLGMYVCYLLLETISFYTAYKGSEPAYQKKMRLIWWIVFFMPLYRFIVYWFRIAGMVAVLTEEKSWKVQNPITQVKDILYDDYIDFVVKVQKMQRRDSNEQ